MKLTVLSKGFHTEKILIDGKELNRVSKIQVNMSGKEIPTATIELIPDEIEVDGEFYFIKDKPLKDYGVEELYNAIAEKTNGLAISVNPDKNSTIIIESANMNLNREQLAEDIGKLICERINNSLKGC